MALCREEPVIDSSKTWPFERLLQHFTEIRSPEGAVREEEMMERPVM